MEPWCSRYLFRRYLDPKSLPKIHSQKGLGALGESHVDGWFFLASSFFGKPRLLVLWRQLDSDHSGEVSVEEAPFPGSLGHVRFVGGKLCWSQWNDSSIYIYIHPWKNSHVEPHLHGVRLVPMDFPFRIEQSSDRFFLSNFQALAVSGG